MDFGFGEGDSLLLFLLDFLLDQERVEVLRIALISGVFDDGLAHHLLLLPLLQNEPVAVLFRVRHRILESRGEDSLQVGFVVRVLAVRLLGFPGGFNVVNGRFLLGEIRLFHFIY